MSKRSQWLDMTEADPEHSYRYAARFKDLAASGADIDGEARLIDAMAPRGARILDAGCGAGRVAGYLAARGHDAYGVDIDPVLITQAKQDFPDVGFTVGDLADPRFGSYDVIVCAGNVMTFLHPETRRPVLENLHDQLASTTPPARLVIGFGADRGYDFQEFLDDAAHARLELEAGYSTWEMRPFSPDSDFLVAVFIRAEDA